MGIIDYYLMMMDDIKGRDKHSIFLEYSSVKCLLGGIQGKSMERQINRNSYI